jgi:protein-tyrosine phosphatase
MTVDERLLTFEACFNFRDLGGYGTTDGRRVRWGRLYRSDTLHRLTGNDLARFRALGLRTVIDLRAGNEVEQHGRLRIDGDDIAWHNLPMIDDVRLREPPPGEAAWSTRVADAREPGEGYALILAGGGSAVAAVFGLLTRDGALPAVFHCTSGKDRTGIVAALVLDVLGVPDDTIAADYALTQETRARASAWISRNEPEFAAFLSRIPPEWQVTRPEMILEFLRLVRAEHGSVSQLLTGLGVAPADLDGLRADLLEE